MRLYVQALHLAGIVGVLILVWKWVVLERHGPVVLTLTRDHGLHLGDIPVIVVGALVVSILEVRLLRGEPASR